MANGHGGHRPGAGRKPDAIQAIRKRALEDAGGDAERALAFIIAILDDEAQPIRLRKECAIEVMDRVWGKSKQTSEITGKDGGPLEINTIEVIRPSGGEG